VPDERAQWHVGTYARDEVYVIREHALLVDVNAGPPAGFIDAGQHVLGSVPIDQSSTPKGVPGEVEIDAVRMVGHSLLCHFSRRLE